jgi:hypothetical protein
MLLDSSMKANRNDEAAPDEHDEIANAEQSELTLVC